MKGMKAGAGTPLEGEAHLRQSIETILTTPIGSRVMLREFGSQLPDLIDQPFNAVTRMKLFGAVATALQRWEPRFSLTAVAIDLGGQPGQATLQLRGRRTDVPARAAPAAFDFNLNLGRGLTPSPAA